MLRLLEPTQRAWSGLRVRLRRTANFPWFLFKAYRMGKLRHALENPEIARQFDYSPAIVRFFEDHLAGADRLLTADLSSDSVVFDVGAYRGEWARDIAQRYRCRLHCFEPNPEDYAILTGSFQGNGRVACHPFGLAGAGRSARLSVAGMGSSVHAHAPLFAESRKLDVELRDAAEVLAEHGHDSIDLLKINIEGGEYELLDRLLDAGLITRLRCIRVQFHRWFDGADGRRARIRNRLSRTHRIEWDYPFVWESWLRRSRE